jgi:hypothetical protein
VSINNIVSKLTKISNKKKKLEALININKLNDKLDRISEKIEFIRNAIKKSE